MIDLRAYRTYQAALLGGLAILLLARIGSGDILFAVHQRMVLLVALAAVGLLVLAQWAMRSRTSAAEGPSDDAQIPARCAWQSNLAWMALALLVGVLLPGHGILDAVQPLSAPVGAHRAPSVVYLAPVDAPELWRAAQDGTAQALTQSGGNVFDFSVAPDGGLILFSEINAEGGVDLWEMQPDGSKSRLLLPCGKDLCATPVLHPDGRQVAYSRRQAGALAEEGAGVPRLWLLDRETLATERLHADPNIGGFEPAWSADGRWLAYFDGLSGGVRVYDMETSAETLLPSEMGITGTWGRDGRLYYLDNTLRGETMAVFVQWFSPKDGQSGAAFGSFDQPLDYSLPALSPDGKRAALALRPLAGGPTKQIWILPMDGGAGSPLIDDATHHYAAYSWDASGERLVFQRLEINHSDSRPQVAWWDGETISVLADDAYLPRWLP